MVALKSASEIDLFLRKAPAGAALVLIFGTDDGLVAERGRALPVRQRHDVFDGQRLAVEADRRRIAVGHLSGCGRGVKGGG